MGVACYHETTISRTSTCSTAHAAARQINRSYSTHIDSDSSPRLVATRLSRSGGPSGSRSEPAATGRKPSSHGKRHEYNAVYVAVHVPLLRLLSGLAITSTRSLPHFLVPLLFEHLSMPHHLLLCIGQHTTTVRGRDRLTVWILYFLTISSSSSLRLFSISNAFLKYFWPSSKSLVHVDCS